MNSFSPPLLALVLVALLLGFLAAIVLRRFTPRKSLRKVTVQLQAELLAMRLFAEQPGNFMRGLPRIVGLSLLRIGLLLPACLLLLPIGLWVSNQLELRFARQPLVAGDAALVTLRLTENEALAMNSIQLNAAQPLVIQHGPLHDPDLRTIYWSIGLSTESTAKKAAAQAELEFAGMEETFTIPVQIGDAERSLPAVPACWSRRFTDRLLLGCPMAWPDELPLQEISIEYPQRKLTLAGRSVNWPWPFLVVFLLSYAVTRYFWK